MVKPDWYTFGPPSLLSVPPHWQEVSLSKEREVTCVTQMLLEAIHY
jgi:hypothetical protein